MEVSSAGFVEMRVAKVELAEDGVGCAREARWRAVEPSLADLLIMEGKYSHSRSTTAL